MLTKINDNESFFFVDRIACVKDEIDQIRYTEVKDGGITISALCHLFPLYRGINTDIDTGISSG